MPDTSLKLSKGLVTSKDPTQLANGELQQATGVWMRPGDGDRVWKIDGRTLFGDTGSGSTIKGLQLCQFDETGEDGSSGTDYLVAFSGTSMYGASPGDHGTFSALATGLSSDSIDWSSAHQDGKWFFTNKQDNVRVLQRDGTVRIAGMRAPSKPTFEETISLVASTVYPTEVVYDGSESDESLFDGFLNHELAYDTDEETASVSIPVGHDGINYTTSYREATWGGWDADVTAPTKRILTIKWRVSGTPISSDLVDSAGDGTAFGSGFAVVAQIEYSVDAGVTWSDIVGERGTLKGLITRSHGRVQIEKQEIDVDPTDVLQVRFRLIYIYSAQQPAVMNIYSIKVVDGSDVEDFSLEEDLHYAITEWDEVNRIESVASETLTIPAAVLVSQNELVLNLPEATNSNTTHFRIYRTAEGGNKDFQLGRLDQTPVSNTTWSDLFETPATTQPSPLIQMVRVASSTTPGEFVYIPLNSPPPPLEFLLSFQGALVGGFGRALHYAATSLPESWPNWNIIDGFNFEEHDELVGGTVVGSSLLLGARGVMIVLDDLPRSIQGNLVISAIKTLKGAPGCVGRKAITSFAIDAEPLAAWVSPHGIHITDGHTTRRVSDDIDWYSMVDQASLSTAVLEYDERRQLLVFSYDADTNGSNNRYILLHFGPEHRKGSAGTPGITGPHYGKFADIADGLVSSSHKVYSGSSDGNVYLEWSGKRDPSNSYNSSGTLPFIVKTGRQYMRYAESKVWRAGLRHTAVTGGSIEVTWVTGRDGHNPQTKTFTVPLDGAAEHTFIVNLGGQWHEVTLTHTGEATFGISDFWWEVDEQGKPGKVVT